MDTFSLPHLAGGDNSSPAKVVMPDIRATNGAGAEPSRLCEGQVINVERRGEELYGRHMQSH